MAVGKAVTLGDGDHYIAGEIPAVCGGMEFTKGQVIPLQTDVIHESSGSGKRCKWYGP
jgi:hypothetical protein